MLTAVRLDDHPADMAGVNAFEGLVVEPDVDRVCAVEAEFEFEDHVPVRQREGRADGRAVIVARLEGEQDVLRPGGR